MISIHSIFTIAYYYVRPLIKWFLRKTTNLCELQRICYGEVPRSPRILAVEFSLNNSKTEAIRDILYLKDYKYSTTSDAVGEAVKTVIKVKKINPQVHIDFVKSFVYCVKQIWNYSDLNKKIEELRCIQYNSNNPDHEEKLLKLWKALMPHEQLESRLTKQWQYLGFQGDDPKTDFRGMGLLGLENLLFFGTYHSKISQRILLKSQHPRYGYGFALVGINLTHFAYHLMREGTAKRYMYRFLPSINLNCFHEFYCWLYIEFDNFWTISKPNNIMDFSYIRDKFEKDIRAKLNNPSTNFKFSVAVEDV